MNAAETSQAAVITSRSSVVKDSQACRRYALRDGLADFSLSLLVSSTYFGRAIPVKRTWIPITMLT